MTEDTTEYDLQRARIATPHFYAMIPRDASLGLATMCIGVAQGIATIFERA